MHGIVRDVTEIKKAEAAYDEQRQQLDAIVENSTLGIALSGMESFLKTNKAFQELFGYDEVEILNHGFKDLSHPEDLEESIVKMKQLIGGKIDKFTINKRYIAKSGKVVWAKTNIGVVRNLDGSVRYQVAIVDDITEELKNITLIETLNNIMGSILGKNNMYEIGWEISRNITHLLGFQDCVVYLLDKDTQMLSQIAAYGPKLSDDHDVLNSLSIPVGQGIVGDVARTGVAEVVNDTSKDKRYFADLVEGASELTVPIKVNGEVIGIIDSEHSNKNFFTQDHLDILTTVAGLAATQLKNALSLQLREKAEKEKEIVLKDLKKSNQELKDFAHVVSHDLKSPLRSMNALISWVQEDLSDFDLPHANENLGLLIKKIDRMDLLINGILDYASVDQVKKKKKEVDLNELIDEIIETIHVPFHIKVNTINKLPVVLAEKSKLIQLFQNLISNAVKYCDKDEGLVEIDCKQENEFWVFSVKDNGIGIPSNYFEKIFKVFQVLEETDDSTGVGLSIVKKVVDYYGGNVWLESEVGEGTTFYFTIPVNDGVSKS